MTTAVIVLITTEDHRPAVGEGQVFSAIMQIRLLIATVDVFRLLIATVDVWKLNVCKCKC